MGGALLLGLRRTLLLRLLGRPLLGLGLLGGPLLGLGLLLGVGGDRGERRQHRKGEDHAATAGRRGNRAATRHRFTQATTGSDGVSSTYHHHHPKKAKSG